MMSTVGLELTNFSNPELTWKKGPKGNRTARRPTKRPLSWNLAVGVEPAPPNDNIMDDKSVSESEKLGVAILGQRFGNMIEHVPLKKRVTMFKSLSPPPPQTPSPQTEVSEQQRSHPNSDEKIFDEKTSEESKEKTGFFADFSGIEMLATTACNNTLVGDSCHAKENGLAASLVPLENTEGKFEISPVQDNAICLSDKSTHGKNENNVDESAPSRDNRLHWDLNVPMDAWEQPCDFDSVPEDMSVDEKINLPTTCKVNDEPQNIKVENVQGSSIAPGFGNLPHGSSVLGIEEDKEVIHGDCTPTENAQPSAGTEISMEDIKTRPIEDSDVALPYVSVTGNITCETESTVLNDDTEKFARDSIGEKISVNSSQSPKRVPDELLSYENKFKSPAVEGQIPISVDGNGHAVSTHNIEFDSPSRVSSGPTSSSGKGNKECRSDVSCHSGGCHSGVYQDEKSNFVAENSMEQLQAGYDSQIEDGELREPYLPCWEENEEEDVEFVDYGSECEEQGLEAEETDEKKMKVDNTGFAPSGSDTLTKNTEVTDGGKVKMDGRSNSKDYSSRVPGFRSSTDRNRSDVADNSYPRAERQSGFHMGEYNSSYHGSYGSRRFRPKSDIESRGYTMGSDRTVSESAGFSGFERRNTTRRLYLGSSNGFHRPFTRKRSPMDSRHGTYGGPPIREFSPDRHKFKRYPPPGINRNVRDEYHRPMPDDSNDYPNRFPLRSARRDRSLSPISGGRFYYKSRSRSRTRSPVPCAFPRERNESSRNRSRSPRAMDKVRFPFQKRFVADCDDDDVMCGPRGAPRFSNPRNSRWFDDRTNNGADNFRSRKSSPSGRMLRPPSQRFDSNRRDDYVRPSVGQQARRFQDGPDGGAGTVRGGGYKYESSDDDRRKYGNNRYESFSRARRYDTTDGGPVRRFQYNLEESFPANES